MAAYLVSTSAFILLAFGTLHLVFTFSGTRFHPRDEALKAAMQDVAPRISRQTTMWKAWIGFNASHSYGAILFGLVYGYLALARPTVLFGSTFLLALGLVFLGGYVFLGKRYWFSTPYRGTLAATALYVAALVVHFA